MPTPNHQLTHVYNRIAERVSRTVGTSVSSADVREILTAKTLGWPDGVVAAVQQEALEYGIADPSGEGGKERP